MRKPKFSLTIKLENDHPMIYWEMPIRYEGVREFSQIDAAENPSASLGDQQ